MPDSQWIGAIISLILFLFSVINGLAFLINKKDSEKQSELMRCISLELSRIKKGNGKEHEELFNARREIEKEVEILKIKVEKQ